MSREKEVFFVSDDYVLNGVLHLPEAEDAPVVVGSHGLFADGDSPKQKALAEELCARGVAFLRFHHRGCSASDGEFTEATTLSGRVQDLLSALEFLHTQPGLGEKRGLFGSSLGAAAVITAALSMRPPPAAVVVNAPPARGRELAGLLAEDPRVTTLSEKFFEEMNSLDLLAAGSIPLQNVLVFHGEADAVVPVSHGRGIHKRLAEPKGMVIFPHGDHAMSRLPHQEQFVKQAADWFVERLG
ncbi:MAG: alpha/beta hydrolase [Deltaproteobacteria bacterium]|nr:alpha/beta hydrolase [Deltaproteobacteria bacterium]